MTAPAFEQLLAVQEHDLAADRVRHRVAHLPELEETRRAEDELGSLAARIAEVEERRADLGRTQKRLEDELAAIEAKSVEVDRRLYSGTVSAPRELEAMQEELAGLARRRSILEDQDLEVMVEAEPVDEELRGLHDQHRALEERLAELRDAIAAAQRDGEEELSTIARQRAEAVTGIPDDLLAHYEELHRRLRTPAAARLSGTSCGGCHLTLPATEIDRIRKQPDDALVHCEECGCILVR